MKRRKLDIGTPRHMIATVTVKNDRLYEIGFLWGANPMLGMMIEKREIEKSMKQGDN